MAKRRTGDDGKTAFSILCTACLAAACTADGSTGDAEGGQGQASESGAVEGGEASSGGGEGATGTTSGPTTGATTGSAAATGEPSSTSAARLRATYYGCFAWNIPVEQAVHIIGFKPIEPMDPHVHHYVLGISPTPVNTPPGTLCGEWVEDMVWGWAPGGTEIWLPEHVGFRAGDNGTVTFYMQIHYNNPLGDTFADNGGFDAYYVKNLRQYDAGMLRIGDIAPIEIPPGNSNYEHLAVCPPAQSQAFPGELHAFGFWLHAHELGKTLWSQVYRGGQLASEFGRSDPYDFEQQNLTYFAEEISLLPGDTVNVHCVYDSSARSGTTRGGPATQDEMCINFVYYYPDSTELEGCGNF